MGQRRKKDLATIRRRVEDDGDEEGSIDVRDLDDDSFSEDSTQEELRNLESNYSQNSEAISPTLSATKNGLKLRKPSDVNKLDKANDTSKKTGSDQSSDLKKTQNGLRSSDYTKPVGRTRFCGVYCDNDCPSSSAVDGSALRVNKASETHYERRRREHEEYKKKRQEDPSFVPNRGAFFMHDHRHSGPAANGFRPFSKGRGRGKMAPGISTRNNSTFNIPEPSDAPWTHDMHEIISESAPRKKSDHSYLPKKNSNAQSKGIIDTVEICPSNRALSVTKSLGIVQIRVALPTMSMAVTIPGISVKQYTRLPDHRPPLRRDKPVRISLPEHQPRYIFPAADRSFIFIPRALRPNQQGFGGRRRGRPIFGPGEGYSRRTSVFGDSMYGSGYSPSVGLSRRSSLAHEGIRDNLVSPNGSVYRAQVGVDSSRPVVRLPPLAKDTYQQDNSKPVHVSWTESKDEKPPITPSELQNDFSLLPSNSSASKLATSDELTKVITIDPPKPPRAMSKAENESSDGLRFNPPQQHEQPFHQQVPAQVSSNDYSHEALLHSRNTSYNNLTSTGTPLSQIPERAIHAQPFQPNLYQQQQQQFYLQPYQILPSSNEYYCPPIYNPFVSSSNGASLIQLPTQQPQPLSTSHANQPENQTSQNGIQSLIAQEVNGMVYYFDAAQIPAITSLQSYQNSPSYPIQQVASIGMGVMTPSIDGFYYTQAPQGIMYHPQ